jgi:hypothetical protein
LPDATTRGDNTSSSDLDLLIELKPGRSLLDVAAMKQALEDLFRTTGRRGHETIAEPILSRRRVQEGSGDLKDDRAYLPHLRDAIAKREADATVGK